MRRYKTVGRVVSYLLDKNRSFETGGSGEMMSLPLCLLILSIMFLLDEVSD